MNPAGLWRGWRLLALACAALALSFVPSLRSGADPTAAKHPAWKEFSGRGFSVVYPEGFRGDARAVARLVSKGAAHVAAHFGRPFVHSFTVRLFEDRGSMTEYWRQAWSIPDLQPECWMVASGTASTLALLSPSDWSKEACDHDPSDAAATQQLITHELVHVYHGQINPDPEFDSAEEMGWFVEGLAVAVSGQLDGPRLDRARRAVAEGKGPRRLADAWSGPDRYGIAGSLVSWLEKTRGREAVLEMMRCTSTQQILALAGSGEQELLAAWREWLKSAPSAEDKTAPVASCAGAQDPSTLQ